MDFSTSPRATAFRQEVRSFLAEHMNDDVRERVRRSGTEHDWALHAAMAARGWVAAALPPSLGGQGRGPEEMAVLQHELEVAGAPTDGFGTAMAIVAILSHVGSEFHRTEILPKMLSGEAIGCLGYSEPEAGSDVAAATTRAVRDGDCWVVSGQKVFTSLADQAEWIFLLTRTSQQEKKHQGLTFFLVPARSEGVEVRPIFTFSGKRTNVTFYNDVVVPDAFRVGEVDRGWDVMLVALAFERGVLGGAGYNLPLLDAAFRLCAEDRRLADDPSVLERLAQLAIDTEVSSLLAERSAWIASTGALPGAEGTMAKLFASEAFNRVASALLDMLGPEGVLEGEAGPGRGFFEHAYRFAPVTTVWGGTSEIQRNLIAERVLGLPRRR